MHPALSITHAPSRTRRKPAYVNQYALQRKATEPGSQSKSKYIEKAGTAAATLLGDYDTWQDAVRDMPRQRQKLEKKTRKRPGPRRRPFLHAATKREQINWDEVIRAEAVAEAQRLELERAAASPQVDEGLRGTGRRVSDMPRGARRRVAGARVRPSVPRGLPAAARGDGMGRRRGANARPWHGRAVSLLPGPIACSGVCERKVSQVNIGR